MMIRPLAFRAGSVILPRAAPSARKACQISLPATTSRLFSSAAVLSASSRRKSDNVERAIRIKSQQKARARRQEQGLGAGQQDDRADGSRQRPHTPRPASVQRTSEGSFPRRKTFSSKAHQIRHRTVIWLMDLFYDGDKTSTVAYLEADQGVRDLSPIMRRDPRIYNILIRHALRAGKGQTSLNIVQDMKKNGVAPTIETYLALFKGLPFLRLDVEKDTRVVAMAAKLFEQAEDLWTDAHTPRNGSDEELEPDVSAKGEALIMQTAETYRKAEREARQALAAQPDKFAETCRAYIKFLVEVGLDGEAVDLVSRSDQIARPNPSGAIVLPDLPDVLSQELAKVLRHSARQKNRAPSESKVRSERAEAAVKSRREHSQEFSEDGHRSESRSSSDTLNSSYRHNSSYRLKDNIVDDGPPGWSDRSV